MCDYDECGAAGASRVWNIVANIVYDVTGNPFDWRNEGDKHKQLRRAFQMYRDQQLRDQLFRIVDESCYRYAQSLQGHIQALGDPRVNLQVQEFLAKKHSIKIHIEQEVPRKPWAPSCTVQPQFFVGPYPFGERAGGSDGTAPSVAGSDTDE